MTGVSAALAALAAAVFATAAQAGSNLQFGFADDTPKWYGTEATSLARGLGAGGFRLTLQWDGRSTRLSATDAGYLGTAVSSSHGLRTIVAVYGHRASDAPQDDAGRDRYCAYVQDVLRRFPTIDDVVIWNEPNKPAFWSPQFDADGTSVAPRQYEALLARCYDVLHAFRPTVNVLGLALSPNGHDDPTTGSNGSHSPGNFIRRLGEAYRASGRSEQLLDTVAYHVYGATSAERPWKQHPGSTRIAQGDWDKLTANLHVAFDGTGQRLPGACVSYRCTEIWYLESGFQTAADATKASLYSGTENESEPLPDRSAGEPDAPTPSADSPAPDQATQITDAIRLAYCQSYVGAFYSLQLWDEAALPGWQSAPLWADRSRKDSYDAFRQAIAAAAAHTIDCSSLKGGAPARPDTTAPAAPAAPAITASKTGDGKIALDWPDGTEGDLAGYAVYRSTTSEGPYTPVVTIVRGSALGDTGENGTTYHYVVAAVDSADNESAPTAEVAATPRAPTVASSAPWTYAVRAGKLAGAGAGGVDRLKANDGLGIELTSVAKATELEATATVTVPAADVTELTLDVDGQASSATTAQTVSIWDWAVNAWFPVFGPLALGSVDDRIVTWSTTSPQRFLAPAGDVRVRVRDTRGGSFVSRLDQLRVSATY